MSTGQWENVAINFGADSPKYRAGRDFQKKFDTAFDPSALVRCLPVPGGITRRRSFLEGV